MQATSSTRAQEIVKFVKLREQTISVDGYAAEKALGGGCGIAGGHRVLSPDIWDKVKNHPCYSDDAHHYYARMHVAVAPGCNIHCNYCNRKFDCSNESRPGVVSERLTPEQAAKKVVAVASAIPQLTVVGVAGPGDALANADKTFRTFELIKKATPDVKLCLSTNGLALPDHIDKIVKLGVDHVTITINMVDPYVGAQIYGWIFHRHKRWTGRDAAKILSERQLNGLEQLAARGVLCKVNSVLIPGINDEHLIEVNREIKARGAFLHNIMPLISAPEHGTVFGLAGRREPSAQELKTLQDACEGGTNLMRHCRQCRADAVGLLGEDRCAEFAVDKLNAISLLYDPDSRAAYQANVERSRQANVAARDTELTKLFGTRSKLKLQIAVATRGGGLVNQHFGHAREFQIFEVSSTGTKLLGHRRVDAYCQGGDGDDDVLKTVIRAISDCQAVLVAKIGHCPRRDLEKAGIIPIDQYAHEPIESSIVKYFKEYLTGLQIGEIVHPPRDGALIRQGAFVTTTT